MQKDVPGFIANRMQHALWREAISIVENGIADAATVDEAVRYSFGLRLPQLGPMENADMVGTDLTYNIHDYILRDLEDSHEPSPCSSSSAMRARSASRPARASRSGRLSRSPSPTPSSMSI
ncbi:3-hydroxyacyl-CoA dehydrogenase family protein [Flavonifractor plautii]|nr:3-hydroxyacyl-CoA dehydrogenase family protein [Flavonifractor plautii]